MNEKKFFVYLVVLGLLLTGLHWTYWKYMYSGSRGKHVSVKSLSMPAPEDTSNWEVYVDPIHGFAMKYPSNWDADTSSSGVFFSKKTLTSGVFPSDGITLYISAPSDTSYVSVDRGTKFDTGIQRFKMKVAGTDAIRVFDYGYGFEGEHGYSDNTDFFSKDNTRYQVRTSYNSDKNKFLQKAAIISGMLSSIVFLDSSQVNYPYASYTPSEITAIDCDTESGKSMFGKIEIDNRELCKYKKSLSGLTPFCYTLDYCLRDKTIKWKEFLCDKGVTADVRESCTNYVFSYEPLNEIKQYKRIDTIKDRQVVVLKEGESMPVHTHVVVRNSKLQKPIKKCEDPANSSSCSIVDWEDENCAYLSRVEKIGKADTNSNVQFLSVDSCREVAGGVEVVLDYYNIP